MSKKNEFSLIDLIANHLEENGHNPEVTKLGDKSGCTIEFKKRKDNYEYLINLEFDGKGIELQDVSVFGGEVVEKVNHRKLI